MVTRYRRRKRNPSAVGQAESNLLTLAALGVAGYLLWQYLQNQTPKGPGTPEPTASNPISRATNTALQSTGVIGPEDSLGTAIEGDIEQIFYPQRNANIMTTPTGVTTIDYAAAADAGG